MTEHLTDEQLDALEHELRTRCQQAIERLREFELEDMAEHSVAYHTIQVIDGLHGRLRSACAAHQATQAERDRLAWHMANIRAQAGYRCRSCERCQFAYQSAGEALGKEES